MGDNIYLGDRNGVRTPMQWSGDRNGGFSRADPARLFAPPIMDPVYGYQSINVEAQERYPFSLLNWMKRMIALRKQHSVLGRGALEFVNCPNRKVLCLRPPRRARDGARGGEPLTPGAAGCARPRRVRGARARRDDGRDRVPAHRRGRVSALARDRTATSCSASNRTSRRSPPVQSHPSRSSSRSSRVRRCSPAWRGTRCSMARCGATSSGTRCPGSSRRSGGRAARAAS